MPKFIQLMYTPDGLYALGEDGTVWLLETDADGTEHWVQYVFDA